MLRGSCACGKVRYRISGDLIGPVTLCHCWRCRKQSGSSFGTTSGVRTTDFQVVQGEDMLAFWDSSPGVRRHFARCCGSPIFKTDAHDSGELGLRLGTLDTDPGITAGIQFLTGSKAPWIALDPRLPCQRGGPPFPDCD